MASRDQEKIQLKNTIRELQREVRTLESSVAGWKGRHEEVMRGKEELERDTFQVRNTEREEIKFLRDLIESLTIPAEKLEIVREAKRVLNRNGVRDY